MPCGALRCNALRCQALKNATNVTLFNGPSVKGQSNFCSRSALHPLPSGLAQPHPVFPPSGLVLALGLARCCVATNPLRHLVTKPAFASCWLHTRIAGVWLFAGLFLRLGRLCKQSCIKARTICKNLCNTGKILSTANPNRVRTAKEKPASCGLVVQ